MHRRLKARRDLDGSLYSKLLYQSHSLWPIYGVERVPPPASYPRSECLFLLGKYPISHSLSLGPERKFHYKMSKKE
jgi:hypothetical protein